MDEEGNQQINLIFNVHFVGCMSLSAADDILGCHFRKWLLWSMIQGKKCFICFCLPLPFQLGFYPSPFLFHYNYNSSFFFSLSQYVYPSVSCSTTESPSFFQDFFATSSLNTALV